MKLQKVIPLATFVFIIACGTVMLPLDSLTHWGDLSHTTQIVSQYLMWEETEVEAPFINIDPTIVAHTPDAVVPLLETPRAMVEFMATVAEIPFPQGTPVSEETPAACKPSYSGPLTCPSPPPATPTPIIFAHQVITENHTCASVSVAMNAGVLADDLCQGNLDPLLPGQPLTIYCQVYTYIPNSSGTPEPYIRYHVPVYDILEVMDEIDLVESGDIPDVPDPRPTCELPCPPGCECSSGLRMVEKDDYEDDDEPSEATVLHPDDWTEGSEYVREYQETDKHTFHRTGDRDCMAINRQQWMNYDHFDIQVIQDPYVSASIVTSQARIELPASYSAGCSSYHSCDMHGGAGEITMPSEDPWFCVRPAPSKCADFDDGSYIVTIQAHLPMPTPPPPPPTP